MARQSKAQKDKVERVMHEFKEGELEQGRTGRPVRSRKQAVAIALSEAGASRQDGSAKGRAGGKSAANGATPRASGSTTGKPKARAGKDSANGRDSPSKAALYAEAKKRDLPGRSTMTKAELERALGA